MGKFIGAAGRVNDEALDQWLFEQHDAFVARLAESMDLEAGFQESLRRAQRGSSGT